MNTLLIGEIHFSAKELLAKKTNLKQISNEEFQNSSSAFPEIEAVFLRTFTKLGKNELQNFPKLKYVVSCSVGIDNLETEELKKRKIELIYCPGTNANSVAEHTLYLILALLREDQRKPFFELKNKTIGIIGFGAIGKLVAKKLSGFETKIIAYDVIPQDKKILQELKTEMRSIKEVCQTADIITIHVPLMKETEKLLNTKLFSLMKKDCFFINTSRAELIDETALLKYVQEGKFRGVGLDVYSENLKKELIKLKQANKQLNLILSEHVAAQGEDSFGAMCLDPVKQFIQRISS